MESESDRPLGLASLALRGCMKPARPATPTQKYVARDKFRFRWAVSPATKDGAARMQGSGTCNGAGIKDSSTRHVQAASWRHRATIPFRSAGGMVSRSGRAHATQRRPGAVRASCQLGAVRASRQLCRAILVTPHLRAPCHLITARSTRRAGGALDVCACVRACAAQARRVRARGLHARDELTCEQIPPAVAAAVSTMSVTRGRSEIRPNSFGGTLYPSTSCARAHQRAAPTSTCGRRHTTVATGPRWQRLHAIVGVASAAEGRRLALLSAAWAVAAPRRRTQRGRAGSKCGTLILKYRHAPVAAVPMTSVAIATCGDGCLHTHETRTHERTRAVSRLQRWRRRLRAWTAAAVYLRGGDGAAPQR
jgi:hypothetical protein